jgi:hypothetical protein
VRERLLASATPGCTVVVVDLTGAQNPSDAGTNLAFTLAETCRVRLLLPGATSGFADHVRSTLRLSRSLEPGVYRSGGMPELEVVLRDESALPSTPGWPADQPSRDGQTMTVVAMPPTATRSDCLAAARRGDLVILVVARSRTTSTAITRMVEDLAEMGKSVHGSVLVDRQRSLEIQPLKSRPVLARIRRMEGAKG